MRCETFMGRLVEHPCGRLTASRCDVCDKPTCHRHLSKAAPKTCVVCTNEYTAPGAPVKVTMEEMLSFEDGDFDAFEQALDRHRVPWADS